MPNIYRNIIYLIIAAAASLTAQSKRYTFEQITRENGLTQNNINYITQDIFGYTWISTEEGLNKYSGYDIKKFRHEPGNSNSPRGNWMHSLFTDSFGNIYISQAVGGIDIYNQVNNRFSSMISEPDDSATISSNLIPKTFLEDTNQKIWIGFSGQGLNRYDPQSKKVERFLPNAFNKNSVSGFNISSIHQDKKNDSSHIWVATIDRGLNKVNINTGEVFRYEWRNIQYPKDLINYIEANTAEQKAIAEIDKVADSSEIIKTINIEKKINVLIICAGEAFEYNKFDYGRIIKNGNTIWEFDQRKSFYAGGSNKNRIIIDTIELTPGTYTINYISDESHGYGKWNEIPPELKEYWGIKILEISNDEKHKINSFIEKIDLSPSLPSQLVTSVNSDSAGDIYISTWGHGIIKLKNDTQHFDIIYKEPEQDNPNNYIKELDFINHDLLWALNRKNRIIVIDIKEGRRIKLPEKFFIADKPGQLSVDKYENLWVANRGGGLSLISFKTEHPEITYFTKDVKQKTKLNSNAISFLFSDNLGNTWIGTQRNGLNRINPGKVNFNIALNNLPRNNSGEYPSITCLAEGHEQSLLIGTNGQGIQIFNEMNGSFGSLNLSEPIKNIRSLMISEEKIWIGTFSKGFYIADIKTGRIIDDLFPDIQSELNQETIYCFYKDSKGYIWIGSRTKGLYRINPENHNYVIFFVDVTNPRALPATSVWSIYEDKQDNLWIGTAVGGLSKFNYQSNDFLNYVYDASNPSSLNSTSVTCFAEDDDENFWVGTYSGGINKMERSTGKFSYITTEDGLPNNRIDAMLVDADGCIWISTNQGIARYDPRIDKVKKYTKINGLQSNEFLRGAFLKTDSMMYFGGTLGLNYFNPRKLGGDAKAPKILITEFRKFNTPVIFEKSINQIDEIILSYFDNHFSFEFLAIDYSTASNTEYAYKLEGFDDEWIYSGTRRYASYTNLYPGRYIFRVIAASGEGVWNEEGKSIALIIKPPFWLTWWFFVIIILLLFASLWILHLRRLRIKVKETIAIERIRTNERETVREELARDFHDELGHKLTRITVFTRRLKKQLRGTGEKISEELENVAETSYDLRVGAKDLIWTLKPDEDTLYDLSIRLKDFGDELFNGTEIKFKEKGISEYLQKYTLPMDWKRHLALIFKEAMNNSLKYAECRNVELRVKVESNELIMSLIDDGVGFNTSSETEGYGLNNIKTRANKISGEVDIFSRIGEGTNITFKSTLPKVKNNKERKA